jgi:hypothetical protein
MAKQTKKRIYRCHKCKKNYPGPVEISHHFKEHPKHRTRAQQLKFKQNQRETKSRRQSGGQPRKSIYFRGSKGLPTVTRRTRVMGKVGGRYCTRCGVARKPSHRFCGGCGVKTA